MSIFTLERTKTILKPFYDSSGEHSVKIEFCGTNWGYLKFAINWKCFQGEVQFITEDDLIIKANHVVGILKEMQR